MSLSSKTYDKVREKVKAEAWAKVSCIAFIDGDIVKSTHANYKEADKALCAAHDVREAAGIDTHAFDLIPLSYTPNPGEKVDRRNTVWLP